MSPLAAERLTALWLSDFDRVRATVRKSVRSWELAEDITMQAFAELGAALERNPDMKAVPGLVQTIADRRAMNYFRSQQAMKDALGEVVPLDERRDDEYLQYHAYDDPGFGERFDIGLRGLDGPERDAFILTDLRGLTVREAADVLGTSKSDVDRLRQSALTTMRKELAA